MIFLRFSIRRDWLCQWKGAIFDPPQNTHPLTDHQKIGTGDYVGAPTRQQRIRSSGVRRLPQGI